MIDRNRTAITVSIAILALCLSSTLANCQQQNASDESIEANDPAQLAADRACGRNPAPGQSVSEWAKCTYRASQAYYKAWDASGPHVRVIPQSELGIQKFADTSWAKGSFSAWEGYLNGTLYRILAGVDVTTDADGLVIVDWGGNGEEFYHIKNSGNLEIVSEKNGVLGMTSETGPRYSFNIETRKITKQ